ncbi:hypothetical protein MRX96_057336 [Rhipicephalus microplus]
MVSAQGHHLSGHPWAAADPALEARMKNMEIQNTWRKTEMAVQSHLARHSHGSKGALRSGAPSLRPRAGSRVPSPGSEDGVHRERE